MAYRSSKSGRYLIVIGMMALTLVGSIAFARREPPIAAAVDVRAVPTQIGEWRLLHEHTLDKNTMEQIRGDSFFLRSYGNNAGQRVDLMLVYRRYGRREFAHRPELCYPAAGFSLTSKGKTTLHWGDREVPAVFIQAQPIGAATARTNLAYFFAAGDKTEEDFLKQQVWMAFERVMPNKNGWTFVRLEAPTQTTEEAALAGLKDFMKTFSPAIRRVITTDPKPAS